MVVTRADTSWQSAPPRKRFSRSTSSPMKAGPPVTTLSPTLGLSHLQFEAMLHTARQSPTINDFALICLLGLLGLRIMEATGLDISDLSEKHGHRIVSDCRTDGPILLN